jgi:uncharacterized membrane protein
LASSRIGRQPTREEAQKLRLSLEQLCETDQEVTVTGKPRIASIDLIRGAVMVLMAIDHVRVYSGLPAGGPTPGIFFTRWVTHFCAPAFLFLAGTSAFISAPRHPDLARRLAVRGAWLILLELTYMRLAWTFNLDFLHYEMAGVLWAIGWSMILLAGLVKLSRRLIAAIGLAIIAGHNLLDPHLQGITQALSGSGWESLWKILYLGFFAGPIEMGPSGPRLIVLYSIIPWIGVMAVGYAFGAILEMETARRDRLCFTLGLGAIGIFLVLRGFNLYGDPRPWGFAAANPGATPNAGAARVPEHHQVSRVARLPAHDAGSHHRLGPAAGAGTRSLDPRARPVRPRAVFLLPSPRPADSRYGDGRLEDPPGGSELLALRQPSDGRPRASPGVCLEPAASLH